MNLVHVSSVSMYYRALKVSVATSGQRNLEKVKCLEYLLYGLANVVDVGKHDRVVYSGCWIKSWGVYTWGVSLD